MTTGGYIAREDFVAGIKCWADAKVRTLWEAGPVPWSWDWVLHMPVTQQKEACPYASLTLIRHHPLPSSRAARSDSTETGAGGEGGDLCCDWVDTSITEDACRLSNGEGERTRVENHGTEGKMAVEWQYHITYSPHLRVPVLYFLATRLDTTSTHRGHTGSASENVQTAAPHVLGWEEVERLLPQGEVGNGDTDAQDLSMADRWTVLSQDEHPHLGLPFYHLHPCQTAARMACLRSPDPSPTPPLSELQSSSRPSAESQPGLVYLLQWFSLIAPVLDLPLPAITFARLVSSSNE